MMKPRRVCRSGGGMVTGPAAALRHGHESPTNIRTTCRRTWATSRQTSALCCRTTDLTDTALSHRATGSSAARAGPTGLPCLLLPRYCRFLCRRRRCPGSVLTASPPRGQAASGSGATARWAGSGTAPCPMVEEGTGTEGTVAVETSEAHLAATEPWRATPTIKPHP